jgi:multicomponent Na+:H+ antiporter subunit D
VIAGLQLIAFAGLAHLALIRLRLYPNRVPGRLLDADWLYRRAFPAIVARFEPIATCWTDQIAMCVRRACEAVSRELGRLLADDGRLGRFAATGRMAMAAAVMLVIYLLLYLL